MTFSCCPFLHLHEMFTFGGQEVKVQGHMVWELDGCSFAVYTSNNIINHFQSINQSNRTISNAL